MRLTAIAAACLALVGMAIASDADAAIRRTTAIPAQGLAPALETLASERGFQILYVTSVVRDLRTDGAVGELTLDEALTSLLAGTGLRFEYIDERTVTVLSSSSVPSANSTDSTRVETEKAGEALPASPAREEPVPAGGSGSTRPKGPTGSQPGPASSRPPLPPVENEGSEVLSEVVVTGTHIRGLRNLTAPLIVMDREFIDSTGFTTTVQLIESLPQNFALVNQSATGGDLSGNSYSPVQGSSINLRGVGEGTTLTLINGRRLPLGYDGSAVNIVALPLSAVERVEVLTDGASAIYGSDAVGGVVNFILRQDFDGAETRLTGGMAADVDELRVSQIFGTDWKSGNLVISGEYFERDMLLATDRDFGTGASTAIGSLLPSEKNLGFTLFGRQDLTDNLQLFVDALYTDRDSENRALQTPTSSRTDYVDNTQLSATIGLAREFARGWRAEISGGYGEDDAAIDFFDTSPSAFVASGSIPVDFELRGAELKADGPLIAIPGGDVRLAIGAQWREESQLSSNVFRDAAGVPFFEGNFSREREVDSLYAEASVPLFGTGNARPAMQRLDLSLAVRYDDYSDFGSSTDPRVGLAWQPTQSLTLRGSWGTSYLAPKMRDFDVAFNSALAVDDFADANGLHLLQVNGNSPETLGPQEAENFTLGLDWAPESLPGARFTVNYHDIRYKNRVDSIGAVSYFTIVSDPSAYEGVVIFDPTEAQVLEYIGYGEAGGFPFLPLNSDFTFNPDFDPADVDLIVDARRQNIGVVSTRGIDVSASYDFDALGGQMRVGLDASWMDELLKQITRTSTPVELSDTFSNPTRQRVRGQIGYTKGQWTSNAFVHYRNSYQDNRFAPFVDIDSYTTVDANVGYSFDSPTGPLSNATVTLSAINLFDQDPPDTRIRDTPGVYDLGFDPANASPLGLLVTLDLVKRW